MAGNYIFIALILLVKQGKHEICLQRYRITLLSTEERQRHLEKTTTYILTTIFFERLLTDYDWRSTMNKWLIWRLSCPRPRICVCYNSNHSLCFQLTHWRSCKRERYERFQESLVVILVIRGISDTWDTESITSQRHQCFNSIKGNFEIFPNHRDHLFGVCALMSQQYYRSGNQVQG